MELENERHDPLAEKAETISKFKSDECCRYDFVILTSWNGLGWIGGVSGCPACYGPRLRRRVVIAGSAVYTLEGTHEQHI
jgi:hypothetical protein